MKIDEVNDYKYIKNSELKKYEYEIKELTARWLQSLHEITKITEQQEEARQTVIQLYYSSHWKSDRLQEDVAGLLWDKVKTVFNLTEKAPLKIMPNTQDDEE
jgi:hypothetical protein